MNDLKRILALVSILLTLSVSVSADFFSDHKSQIENNVPRLGYGVAVTDFDQDGLFDFVVTGFGYENLVLAHRAGVLTDINDHPSIANSASMAIGVVACDVDTDGVEELYFLNTDRYSGRKEFTDNLVDLNDGMLDLFTLPKNKENLNLTAGRSVACVDRNGSGKFGIYVANYGGPVRYYESNNRKIRDIAPALNLDRVTGGRSVVAGHIVSDQVDIFASNERGPNFLYVNNAGEFKDKAVELNVSDTLQHGRGVALTDLNYDGRLGIVAGNWNGYHRIYVPVAESFADVSPVNFRQPSRIRTVISADFDNDGFDEIFLNNIGEKNRLFRVRGGYIFEELPLTSALEPDGLGTGAAVADVDGDGILELLISHGEDKAQPISLYKAKVSKSARFLRIIPKNRSGAPARGATVTLRTNLRTHAKTIDAGSGYLCQMEPVAHFGIRAGEKVHDVVIRWTDGSTQVVQINEVNVHHTVHQS